MAKVICTGSISATANHNSFLTPPPWLNIDYHQFSLNFNTPKALPAIGFDSQTFFSVLEISS
jgi:hypothetical protein